MYSISLKKFKPKHIIESGVNKGNATFFYEKSCPDATIYCIEPLQNNILYKSPNAHYFKEDLSLIDFEKYIPKSERDETLVILDDHQHFNKRFYEMYYNKFENIIFEDNYTPNNPTSEYSPKQILSGEEFTQSFTKRNLNSLKNFLSYLISLIINYKINIKEFHVENKFKYTKLTSKFFYFPKKNFMFVALRKYLDIYYEFPQLMELNYEDLIKKKQVNFLYRNDLKKKINESINKYLNKNILFERETVFKALEKVGISIDSLFSFNHICYLKFKFYQNDNNL